MNGTHRTTRDDHPARGAYHSDVPASIQRRRATRSTVDDTPAHSDLGEAAERLWRERARRRDGFAGGNEEEAR